MLRVWISLIAVCCGMLFAQAALQAQSDNRSVVLPQGAAAKFAKKQLCSRPAPPKFDGTWMPTDTDIRALESRLLQVSELRTHEGPLSRAGRKIENPAAYHRQYLGIRIAGKNLIYVNAFDDFLLGQASEGKIDWRTTPVVACDAGHSGWGAVYDPATAKFSHLEIDVGMLGD